jgi:hypothetical protein
VKSWPVILLGALLLVVLVPVAQFLTMGAVNSDLETASPVGWAVGLVFSFVLIAAVVRLLAKRQSLSRPNLVILYCMLTIGVPLMNIGLVRTVFQSIYAVAGEFMLNGNSTYRTAYSAQDAHWFPVVPPQEALAWNKADRLLRLLQDNAMTQERTAAQRKLIVALTKTPWDTNVVAEVAKLGPEEVAAAQAADKAGLLTQELAAQRTTAAARSAAAAAQLPAMLADADELEASLLPVNLAGLDQSSRLRLERELARMAPADRAALEGRVANLGGRSAALRAEVTSLSRADWAVVRESLAARLREQYARLDAEALARLRGAFLYRQTRAERQEISKHDGREGMPNENLFAFQNSLWSDQTAVQDRARHTLGENLKSVLQRLPWRVWVWPMVMWGALCAVIFGLVLVLADWLRHKWIERENLAFPLVEAADFLIRHDAKLETAEDVREPERRRGLFNPLWWVGIGAGVIWISVEALGHYGFTGTPTVVFFDVSKNIFAQNAALREMTHVYLVLSPIVIGLAFLVSLEVSFSVWVIFLALNFVAMLCRTANPNIVDPLYVGYGGGRSFPFWMEQFMGACVCYGLVVLFKSFGGREKSKHWLVGGLLALVAIGLLWSYGMTQLAFVALISLFVAGQTIAGARVRAETGLHTQHVSYEFTKLPIVWGLTGWTGAEIYTRFIALAGLPVTLLTRMLPQQLENFELARRHKVPARTITISAIVAFVTALSVGTVSFLVFSYFWGETFHSGGMPGQGSSSALGIARYPLWVSHFFGEAGLNKFTQVHWIRVWFMVAGAAIVGLLTFLRQRFLRFPLHPLGYLLILMSVYYDYVSPYYKGDGGGGKESSWLWGSVFVAWLVKKLIIKYGGMNTYKHAKPLFLGLVVGAVVTVFAWNMTDFVCSLVAQGTETPGEFVKHFIEKPAFSPRFY